MVVWGLKQQDKEVGFTLVELLVVSSNSNYSKLPPWAPAGFPELELSEGVGLGIVAARNADREPGSYCVIGNMLNSNYSTTEDNISWTNSMYYDSKTGGLYSGSELPENGACKYYNTRVDAEQIEE